MTATGGVMNQDFTSLADALKAKGAAPTADSTQATSGNGSSNSPASGSATISANDFLTLLVTELQNQDPTANTDPNEYINQLVEVNSLEQLININQTLSTALGSAPASSASGSATPQTTGAAANLAPPAASGNGSVPQSSQQTPIMPAALAKATGNLANTGALRTQGNLGVPGVNPAAQRIAHALDGKTRAQPPAGSTVAR